MADTWEKVSGYDWINYSDDAIFEIDHDTKTIQSLDGQTVVSGEERSQYIRFIIDRYYDGIDLSAKTIQIVWKNTARNGDVNAAVNVERTDDQLRFGWLVPQGACYGSKNLTFDIEFSSDDYSFKSRTYSLRIYDGLDKGSVVPEPVGKEWYVKIQEKCETVLTTAQAAVTEAASSATSAAASATKAESAKTAAATSATNAAASASAAAASESTVAASAAAAATSEANAASSASAAATSASGAASAKTAAETAQSAAEAAQALAETAKAGAESAKTEAAASATTATEKAEAVTAYASDSEAWAVGTRDGEAVPETDETYHNSSKYHAEESKAAKTDIEDSIDGVAQEDTAQSALTQIADILEQVTIIANKPDTMNGFSMSLGENSEVLLTYTDPENELITDTITMPQNDTLSQIVTSMDDIVTALTEIAGQADEI